MIAPSPIPQRVATADLVVVGKVVSIEGKAIKAPRFPGDKDKGEYQIAIVKIEDAIYGGKGLTHVRVGFIPPAAPLAQGVQVDGGGGVRLILPIQSGRASVVVLQKDQEVCLFLKNHFDAEFFTAPMYFDAIYKANNPNFAKEVAEAKRCGKLLDDPMAGLKSEKPQDRFVTAVMLLARYRMPRPYMVTKKTEPIDAAQSKLILEALAGADWTQQPGRFDQMGPQQIFSWLGLTPKDGWNQPKDFRQVTDAAKKWLAANKDTYRIQKLVLEKIPAP